MEKAPSAFNIICSIGFRNERCNRKRKTNSEGHGDKDQCVSQRHRCQGRRTQLADHEVINKPNHDMS